MEQYKADILPHELLCRVQNLFPDLCHLCKQEYCVALSDDPIIHCASCGQGCHDQCVLQLLGITRDDLNDENENGLKLLNPHASIGLVYLCEPCQRTVLPHKEKIKTKGTETASKNGQRGSGNAANQSQSPTPSSQVDPQSTGVTQPDSVHGSIDNPSSENVVTNVLEKDENEEHENNAASQNQNIQELRQSSELANNSLLKYRQRDPRGPINSTNNQPLNSQRAVCKYYKQGQCRYGMSGKKDGVCPFSHPKACRRFLRNGRRGCSKNDCPLFHPSMCHSSLNDKTCFKSECKYLHLKGTKRSRANETDAVNMAQQFPSQIAPPSFQHPKIAKPVSTAVVPCEQNLNENFLEQVKSINLQMKEMTNKLLQMEVNYSSLQLQLQSIPNQQPKILQHQPPMITPVYPQLPSQYQYQMPRLGSGNLQPLPGSQ